MAADDVALAWVRMHDEGVRQRVEAGDLDALGELSLAEDEEELVQRLASEFRAPAEVETFETSALFQAMNAGWGKLSPEVLEEVSAQLKTDDEAAEVQGYGGFSLLSPAQITSAKMGAGSTGSTGVACSPMDGTTHCTQNWHFSGGPVRNCY